VKSIAPIFEEAEVEVSDGMFGGSLGELKSISWEAVSLLSERPDAKVLRVLT
jgi:hypothetical protein